MKKEWVRALAALLAVTLTVSVIAACGRAKKEPADSLVASETFVPATVQEMEDDELTALIKEIVGDDSASSISVIRRHRTKKRSPTPRRLRWATKNGPANTRI